MSEARIDFPEVVGKLVSELCVQHDPEFGREVLVRFADGTQLSIAISVQQAVDARFCSEETPDLPYVHRQSA